MSPQSVSLQRLLTQFQSRHPMAALLSELVIVHDGNFIVRAQVQLGGVTLASGLAAAADIEIAEDRAKVRALEAFGIQPAAVAPLAAPLPLPTPPNFPEMNGDSLPANFELPPRSTDPIAPPPVVLPIAPEPTEPSAPAMSLDESPPIVADWYSHITLGADEPSPMPIPASEQEEPTKVDRPSPRKSPPPALDAEPLPPSETVDLSDVITQIDVEMRRLGWTRKLGREHLKRTYGRETRGELSEAELYDFLSYLQVQPTS